VDSLYNRSVYTGGDDLPLVRQVVIRERGCKTRIVTPCVGALSYMSMFMNSLLLSLLETDQRLKSVRDVACECSWEPHFGEVYRSVDMSRATDLMPHDLVRGMVEGICAGLALPPFLRDVFRLCTGPVRMLTSGKWVTTNRGILMGLGTSWPLLSLYNLWLWESAWNTTIPDQVKRRNRVRIVGDDLGSIAPFVVSDKYTSLLVQTGGSPSYGKDYTSHLGLVVLEELFISGKHYPTISVRGVQPVSSVKKGGLEHPWMQGPQLAELCSKFGHPEWLTSYLMRRFALPILRLHESGVPAHLPRELGGGGFPGKPVNLSLASLGPNWVRALRCAMSQGLTGSHLQPLVSAWKDRFEGLLTEWEGDFWRSAQAYALDDHRVGDMGEYGIDPTEQEVMTQVLSVVSATKALVQSPNVRVVHMTPGLVRRRLNKVLQGLNSLVPYPKLTDKPKDMWAGIYDFLNELRKPVCKVFMLPTAELMSTHPSWV